MLLAAYSKCEGEPGYNPLANLSDASMCGSDPNLAVIDTADLSVLPSVYGLQATRAIRARFAWDAENRLVGWEPLLFVSGARKVEFKYDYLGRRVEKQVYTCNGSSWELSGTRRYLWYNWLMPMELDADNQPARNYTWGLDLAGPMGGADASPAIGLTWDPEPSALDGARVSAAIDGFGRIGSSARASLLHGAGAGGGWDGAVLLAGAGGIGGLLAVHDPVALPEPNDTNMTRTATSSAPTTPTATGRTTPAPTPPPSRSPNPSLTRAGSSFSASHARRCPARRSSTSLVAGPARPSGRQF